jgi:adenine-specific DNA-methyltransferase
LTRKSSNKKGDLEVFQRDDTRKNAVPAGLASYDTSKLKPKKYEYEPYLNPQLVWAGKAEHISFEVPTVSIHIHDRILSRALSR